MFQCYKHVEMNKFLCSLARTWMTIIERQFYIIDSLSLFQWNEMLIRWLPECNCSNSTGAKTYSFIDKWMDYNLSFGIGPKHCLNYFCYPLLIPLPMMDSIEQTCRRPEQSEPFGNKIESCQTGTIGHPKKA